MEATVVTISVLIITTLLVKNMLLREKLIGFEEARRQMLESMAVPGNSSGHGLVNVFAIIGLIALCSACFYFGIVIAGG